MIPVGDNDDNRKLTPIENYVLIAINIPLFMAFQNLGSNQAFPASFPVVPEEIIRGSDITTGGLGVSPSPIYFTLITTMFMHGGIAHIAGNMLYLWVFGDNLENVMGHIKYLCFHLFCGILARISHVFVTSFTRNDMLYSRSWGIRGHFGSPGWVSLIISEKLSQGIDTWNNYACNRFYNIRIMDCAATCKRLGHAFG